MIKKFIVVASLGLALTACSGQEDNVMPEQDLGYIEFDTPSGPLPCIAWNSRRSVALSCDWESTR